MSTFLRASLVNGGWQSVWVLAGVLIACSGPSVPPRESPHAPAQPPTPEPPSSAAPAPPSSASAAPLWKVAEVPGEPANSGPAACRGTALDLDALLESTACDTKDKAGPPPAVTSIDTAIQLASPTVRPGASVDLTLLITNRTRETLTLDLDVTARCVDLIFSVGAYDASGNRADFEGGCAAAEMCGRRVIRVELEPRGSLAKKLSFSARVTRYSETNCERLPSRNMKPGTYTMKIGLPWPDPTTPPGSSPQAKASTEVTVR